MQKYDNKREGTWPGNDLCIFHPKCKGKIQLTKNKVPQCNKCKQKKAISQWLYNQLNDNFINMAREIHDFH